MFKLRLASILLASIYAVNIASAQTKTVKIGAIYPMTGSASFLGIPEDRALRMKVDDINKAGGVNGHKLELVVYDTEGNGTKAVQQLRRLIASDFEEAFKKCDMLMGPTSPTTAFNLGEKSDDPVQMYLSDIYTIAVNLAGLPGMSIPAGFGANGRPVGLQIIGNYFSEAKMLNVAHQFQQATNWHLQMPPNLEGK